MPGPKCSVCCHAQIETINRLCLDLSESKRSISARFGLSPTAVQRHRTRHVPAALTRSAERAGEAREDVLREFDISQREKRLARQNTDFELLEEIRRERGDSMRNIPGGKTGLLVRRLKKIGSGKDSETVEEHSIDRDLLAARRRVEEAAGRETGQLGDKGAAVGKAPTIFIVYPPPVKLPPIVIMDIPGRIATRPAEVIDIKVLLPAPSEK